MPQHSSSQLLVPQHSSSQLLASRHSSSQPTDRRPDNPFSAWVSNSGMRPRSPFRGCTFIVLGGFEINKCIKMWRGCNGTPYLSSSFQRPRSCPEVKGPWLNWHHAVLPVPTVVAMVAMSSSTSWAYDWPRQHARKSDHLSLKTALFLRTTRSLLLQRRSVVPGYVSFPSQVPPQPTNCTEEAACSSPT